MKFLGRAKKFLQDLGAESPSKTQTFNLACASGHRVRGERTEGYQALRCPSCGEGVFVLPRSPLPEPEAPAGVAEARGANRRSRSPWVDEGPVEFTDPCHEAVGFDDGRSGGDGAEIVWDDEPAEEGARAAASASPRVGPEDLAAEEIEAARRTEAASGRVDDGGRRAVGRGTEPGQARPGRARSEAPGPGAGARPAPAEPGAARAGRPRRERMGAASAREPIVVEARPRTRSGPRLGLIFALLAFLIVGTIGVRAWRNRRAQFPLIAQQGRDEGIPALEAGEFDRAYQLLSAARSAVDALGGAVEGAEEIRQAADEAAVYVNRCEFPEELLDEVGRKSTEAWEEEFEKLYKGRYLLFDTFILATPEEGGRFELGYVVFPPGEASRFGAGGLGLPDRYAVVDLSGFELFELAPPKRGNQVTFGAKLHSLVRPEGERKHWLLRLEPKGGVYITHRGAMRAAGWPETQTVELPKEDQP